MAAVFADFLLARSTDGRAPTVALGLDTRPTGPAIADVMARVFLARGLAVRYAFICAAPEIMAWARRSGALAPDNPDRLDAFCYVSASHNPPGQEPLRMTASDSTTRRAAANRRAQAMSAVASVSTSGVFDRGMPALKAGACEAPDIAAMASLVASVPAAAVAALFAGAAAAKRRAVSDYSLFAREVGGASADLSAQERELDALAAAIGARGCGIVAEMNGSARSLSIDVDFLSGLGVSMLPLNAVPRRFAHRIVPEGESLEPCRRAVEAAHRGDPYFVLGYVPDCDGDRGNIVYWDEAAGCAKALEAQETFALAALAELAVLASRREGTAVPLAVACNDATSLRIEAIAGSLGAEVFRAETGEANVVGLARSLRERGYEVRVLGEGSNGGVITHPASVRDPLNTVTAILKLLYLRDEDGRPGPFRLWLERSGQAERYRDDFGLADVLASLPRYTTTSVFEDRAALRVRTRDHAALKDAYEAVWRRAEAAVIAKLAERLGPLAVRTLASAGSAERELAGSFGGSGSGGLKLRFDDSEGKAAAFLWMRGSGTEPVFRVMAEVRGDEPGLESWLLERHAAMVVEADSLA